MNILKRGEIYLVNLGITEGSEVNKTRPCILLQNDIGNKFSPTTIIAPISNRHRGKLLTTHVLLANNMFVNERDSIDGVVLLEQIRTVDKSRIVSNAVGKLTTDSMKLIRIATLVSLSL